MYNKVSANHSMVDSSMSIGEESFPRPNLTTAIMLRGLRINVIQDHTIMARLIHRGKLRNDDRPKGLIYIAIDIGGTEWNYRLISPTWSTQ